MTPPLDPRITPARSDLAAEHLRGHVTAQRFAKARMMQLCTASTALRAAPEDAASLHTELLYGEIFSIYEESGDWVWGQAMGDAYVGYARREAFKDPGPDATHRVCALCTPLLPEPNIKRPASLIAPMGACIAIAGREGRFLRTHDGLYVFAGHVSAYETPAEDWVAVAEAFLGVPYVWGGKRSVGIDCSGLMQIALAMGGIMAPRDTDMMEQALGSAIAPDPAQLRRGDLLFWKGHVGVMCNADELLHANAFHMAVTRELLRDALARIGADGIALRTVKRL
jgi:cell wall-associated NlpC family hydrolase